jgi:hypothetical protein
MDVWGRLFCICGLLCVGGGLKTGWSPRPRSPTDCVKSSRNWKSGQGPTEGYTAIDKMDGWIDRDRYIDIQKQLIGIASLITVTSAKCTLVLFEVLTPVVTKSSVFWDITPCSPLKANRRSHLLSHWFLAQLIRLPSVWRRHFPPKRLLTLSGLHGAVHIALLKQLSGSNQQTSC